jgi:hypothetical protein
MLDISKILKEIDNLGREKASITTGIPQELNRALEVMARISNNLDVAQKKIKEAKTSWLTTMFDEPPDHCYKLPSLPQKYAAVAVDGSQIMPDRHEVTLCYLLNTASIILYYGNSEKPIAKTTPSLHYKEEDLFEDPYGGRRVRINEKILATKRTLAESASLKEAIKAARASDIPVVALWDGSLIRWSLEGEPVDYRERVLREYLELFDTAKHYGVPIAGYISDPGSTDVVNTLKIILCDEPIVDCDKCPHKERSQSLPCDAIGHIRDISIFKKLLSDGMRSVLFRSISKILDYYTEHKIMAFYMNVGREIVRIEIPEWVGVNRALLDLTQAVCYDQAQKGRGYPVALSQAHEHAVIRRQEAQIFYEMVERAFVKYGAPITYSLKRISKGY